MWVSACEKALRLLGATEEDSLNEIKTKYKKLVKKFHPDNYMGEKDEFLAKTKEINWAYNYLRKNYHPRTNGNQSEKRTAPNVQKNEGAYTSRKCYGGEGFYCWDPDFEDYGSFSTSVFFACRDIISKKNKEFFGDELYDGAKVIDIVNQEIRLKLSYYIESEYIKPFFCLSKQVVRIKSNKFDTPILASSAPANIGKDFMPFQNTSIEIELRGTGYENRTEHIEKYAKKGDNLVVCCYGDDPRFPEKIEIYTESGFSVGTVPVELAMCITPLVLNGHMDISASVSSVITREMRGKHARIAKIKINLTMSIIKEIEQEKMPIYSEVIKSLLRDYDSLCERIIHAETGFDKEKFFADEFSKFDNEHKWIESEYQTLYIKGTYGEFIDKDRFNCTVCDIPIDINSNDEYIYRVLSLISDGEKSKQVFETKEKYYCEHNGCYLTVEIKPSFRSDIVNVIIKGYENSEKILLT